MDFNINEFKKAFNDLQKIDALQPRSIMIHTGCRGMELFEETVESKVNNTYRIYYGKKIARFIKSNIKLNISPLSGRYYKTIKNEL